MLLGQPVPLLNLLLCENTIDWREGGGRREGGREGGREGREVEEEGGGGGGREGGKEQRVTEKGGQDEN